MDTNKLTGGTLTPAFGRDYKNRASILADLNALKDFTFNGYNGSGYVNVNDLHGSFQVRDASKRKVWVVTIADGRAK